MRQRIHIIMEEWSSAVVLGVLTSLWVGLFTILDHFDKQGLGADSLYFALYPEWVRLCFGGLLVIMSLLCFYNSSFCLPTIYLLCSSQIIESLFYDANIARIGAWIIFLGCATWGLSVKSGLMSKIRLIEKEE